MRVQRYYFFLSSQILKELFYLRATIILFHINEWYYILQVNPYVANNPSMNTRVAVQVLHPYVLNTRMDVIYR